MTGVRVSHANCRCVRPRSKLTSMDQLSIETVRGNQDGIRIIRLIGPFTLQGIFDFQSIYRSGNEPVTIIDLTEVALYGFGSPGGSRRRAHVFAKAEAALRHRGRFGPAAHSLPCRRRGWNSNHLALSRRSTTALRKLRDGHWRSKLNRQNSREIHISEWLSGRLER